MKISDLKAGDWVCVRFSGGISKRVIERETEDRLLVCGWPFEKSNGCIAIDGGWTRYSIEPWGGNHQKSQ